MHALPPPLPLLLPPLASLTAQAEVDQEDDQEGDNREGEDRKWDDQEWEDPVLDREAGPVGWRWMTTMTILLVVEQSLTALLNQNITGTSMTILGVGERRGGSTADESLSSSSSGDNMRHNVH